MPVFVCRLLRGWVGGQQAHFPWGPLGFPEGSSTASLFLRSAPLALFIFSQFISIIASTHDFSRSLLNRLLGPGSHLFLLLFLSLTFSSSSWTYRWGRLAVIVLENQPSTGKWPFSESASGPIHVSSRMDMSDTGLPLGLSDTVE